MRGMILLNYLGMNLGQFKYKTYSSRDASEVIANAENHLVVLAFSASWTGHGQIIDNFYQEMASKYDEVQFLRVDVEKSEDYVQKYGINKVPTTLFLKNGETIGHFEGLLPKAEIEARINSLLNVKI